MKKKKKIILSLLEQQKIKKLTEHGVAAIAIFKMALRDTSDVQSRAHFIKWIKICVTKMNTIKRETQNKRERTKKV